MLVAVRKPKAELVWVEGNDDDDDGSSPATTRLVSS
jgi:hypothetical protein